MSEYTKQAEDFIAKYGITFSVLYVGEDCPTFCEDRKTPLVPGTFPRKNHIHGSHFRLTLTRDGKAPFTVEFWDSYMDAEARYIRKTMGRDNTLEMDRRHGLTVGAGTMEVVRKLPSKIQPNAYDMLACVQKNDPGTFEDFCGDFGYDEDSRRAESVYRGVQKEWQDVARFFNASEMDELQEIA